MSTHSPSRRIDLICLAGLCLLTLGFAAFALQHRALPQEDAAMLMRYAVHLAAGQGVTWNAGSPPVDGATDFLLLVTVAGVVKTGVPVEMAVRGVDVVAHLATVLIVYLCLRRKVGVGVVPAVLTAAYLALGPGVIYISMGFGTPFFALWVAVTWYFAISLAQQYRRGDSVAFAASGLMMGLTRPEGVPLLVLMLVAIVIYRRGESVLPLAKDFAIGFIIPAMVYFAWHWHYFGWPLPNPYYVKGRHLHPDSLKASVRNVLRLGFPFWLAWGVGVRGGDSGRRALFCVIPIAGFALMWVMLSNEMNHAWRFQYPSLPMVLMCWPLALMEGHGNEARWRWRPPVSAPLRGAINAGVAALMLALAYVQTGRNWVLVGGGAEGKYAVARAVAPYAPKQYTMSVTEAGLLPLYSGWRAIDTWGLNDAAIAHHGKLSAAYLDTVRPEMVMFHTGLGTPNADAPPPIAGWDEMVHTLQNYVKTRHYTLAGAFSSDANSSEWYYVRPDCPDAPALVRAITGAARASYTRTVAP